MKNFKTIGFTFSRHMKSSVCALLGLVLAGLTVLCTPGCNKLDKVIGFDENKVKETLLEISNDTLKKNPVTSNSIKAVRVEDLSLVQESFSKRVGYANIVFKSTQSNKELTLKYKVNITGSALDDKQLCEMQLNDPSDGFKLIALCGDL